MRINLSQFKSVITVFFLILIFTNSLTADQSSEIKKLETRIAELEKRVEKLEALLETSNTNEIKFSEKWKNRSLWRQLQVGMSKYQVKNLLVEPRKIDGGAYTKWEYSEASWHSYVRFYDGKLDTWTEPD